MTWLLAGVIWAATIDGPTVVEAGDLAVFTATPPGGHWVILPREWQPRFVPVTLADGRAGLVFASRKTGRITLVYVVCGPDGADVAEHEFENKSAEPQPPPTPPDPPRPDPQPPQPQPPLQLIWVEESTERTPAQAAAQNDREIRAALAAAGWTLRVVDKDIVNEHGRTPPDLKPLIEQAKQLGLPRLMIVDKNGRVWHYPAPADRTAFITQLERLGLRVRQAAEQQRTPVREYYRPGYYSLPRCQGGVCIIGP